MLGWLFFFLLFFVFGKILVFAIKATWHIAKIFCFVILLPMVLIGLVLKGLMIISLPTLIVIGIIAWCVLRN